MRKNVSYPPIYQKGTKEGKKMGQVIKEPFPFLSRSILNAKRCPHNSCLVVFRDAQ